MSLYHVIAKKKRAPAFKAQKSAFPLFFARFRLRLPFGAFYNGRMGNVRFKELAIGNKSKVLFAIAAGRDMTKLDVKSSASLSMTTVISAVEELKSEGLVTYAERKGEKGGKPHAVLNVNPNRRAYGISYKSGVLTAVAADLKGEARETLCEQMAEGASPIQSVLSLALALVDRAPPPVAVALSLNCEEKELILRALEERLGAAAYSATNTAAVACLALWRGASFPVVAVGVGNGVKCAVTEQNGCRMIDLGALPSPLLFTQDGTVLSALSAARVEEVLRRSDYRGNFFRRGDRVTEIKDLAEYSRALSKAVASLVETVDVMLSPAEIVLFGDYLSEAFFARIRDEIRRPAPMFFPAEKEDFALGTALLALKRKVFS